MKRRIKLLLLASVLSLAIGTILIEQPMPSSGQQGSRMPGCECFVCVDLQFEASRKGINLPFNKLSLEEPNCTAGTLAEMACPETLSQMPTEKVKAFCRKIKEGLKFTSFKESCPVLAASCEPDEKQPPEKKCASPAPWFGDQSDCKDVQTPVIRDHPKTVVTLYMCGFRIFDRDTASGNTSVEDYKAQLREWVETRVGSKVCCDKFRAATRSGSKCNPIADIDCDGIANDYDKPMDEPFPEIDRLFSIPEGAPVDPFPRGLNPDDAGFFPPQDKCDCKWELVKGTLNCSPDGKQQHSYQARWRCPATGNEIFTRKEAPPKTPCK